MNADLSEQQLSYSALESLLTTLTLARRGDFSARMDGSRDGIEGEVIEAINDLMEVMGESTAALSKLGQRVQDGQLASRAKVDRAQGGLAEQVRAVNAIVAAFSDHTQQVQLAVGQLMLGDLNVLVDVSPESVHRSGDTRQTADSINKLAAHLKRFAQELTRTASAVGLEGRLNAQLHVEDVHGSWHVLVSAINAMTKALFDQVSDLGDTARALSAGNLAMRSTVTARGDLQPIRQGLNELGATVGGFCIGLRRISSELGQQGRLDIALRQAPPGGDLLHAHEAANNTLALLTGALREAHQAAEHLLAGNLDHVVVAREGDVGTVARDLARLADREKRTQRGLTSMLNGRFAEVPADGDPRDRDLFLLSTRLKHEWLRATHGSLLSAQVRATSLNEFSQHALRSVMEAVGAAIGAYHVVLPDGTLQRCSHLGCEATDSAPIQPGDGLVGRAALDKKPLTLTNLGDSQVRIRTGMLEIVPRALIVYPVSHDGVLVGVVELAFTTNDGSTAIEVLDHVGSELAHSTLRVARPAAVVVAAAPPLSVSAAKLSELEEELVIANARLETLSNELRMRDQKIRALEADRAA